MKELAKVRRPFFLGLALVVYLFVFTVKYQLEWTVFIFFTRKTLRSGI